MTTTPKPICHCAAFARAHGIGSNAARVPESSPARAKSSRHEYAR
jgi:hypothetical protein